MKKKKILVTGGTGYIGSHTVVELQQAGYEVVVIDNLSNSYEWILDKVAEITGTRPVFYNFDLCHKDQLKSFFSENQDVLGVIHFAAFKAVGESCEKPNKYYYNNLVSLINLINCMREFDVNNLVFSSSCTVYGEPDKVPIAEDAPIKKAESPYGNTKQISEEIISDNSKVSNLNAVALRYFNPVGAHPSSLIGELPINKPQSLMPVITQTCIGKQEKFFVHGNDYPTPDGTPIRDYFHVVDLAKAHVLAINYLVEGRNKEQVTYINLGSEKGYSVLEAINEFERVNKVKPNYEIGPRRAGDVIRVFADSTKAKNELGWQAEKTLEDMVRDAWNWEQVLARNKIK